jgi:hypothetical protein
MNTRQLYEKGLFFANPVWIAMFWLYPKEVSAKEFVVGREDFVVLSKNR